MTYDSVAWDFDGVLADSKAHAWRTAAEILGLLGINVEIRSQETFRRYFTRSDVFQEADTAILRDMHRLVMNSRAHLIELFPCISLVARLSIPSEIVTSGLASVAEKVLGEHTNSFVRIRGREVDSKKGLLRAISGRSVFVTDTVVDVARCRELSIPVIAVGWGYDPVDALENAQADFIAESTSELEALFTRLRLMSANHSTPEARNLASAGSLARFAASCMRCGHELPMWSDEPDAELPYENWLELRCPKCGSTPRENGAR